MAERTREMGIRLALGAHPRAVRLVVGTGLRLAIGGVAAGLLLSFWLVRFVASDLFGVGTFDLVTLVGASATLLGVVLLATLIPARRATRIDPMSALRAE